MSAEIAPAGAETIIHYVMMIDHKPPVIAQLSGATPNEKHGDVMPVKAVAGRQRFACDKADMSKCAGKLWEGAHHHGCGDPQFVNCPFCKLTEAYLKDMAEHDKHAREDKGLFQGIFSRSQPAQGTGPAGGAAGTVPSPAKPKPAPAPAHT